MLRGAPLCYADAAADSEEMTVTTWFSSASTHHHTGVDKRIRQAQVRAMHEVMPLAQCASLVCALAVAAVLWQRVELSALLPWLVGRLAISLTRIWYSQACVRQPARHTDHAYVGLALVDGAMWSAMGWGLTPVMDLSVAVVTICVGVAAASLGVIMLHIHSAANWTFVAAGLIPNALYALQRGDDLGYFCFAGFLGLTGILLFEGQRLNHRFMTTLRLRFESELAHEAEKRALQKVQELADMRSRFVATISHEMRTPLHGMLGLLRLVRERADRPPDPRHLMLMHNAGEHLVQVINDVLDFAKLETTGLPIAPSPFRLDTTLHELVDTIRFNAEAKGLTLTLDSDLPADTWVMGDVTRIRQILLNLMGNAIKFTHHGGVQLTVNRDAVTGHTELSVHDTGVGIPADDIERIFQPFHQAEGTYERHFGGSGLGLTISRELCSAMGGSLRCHSAVGQGSVFTCTLSLPGTNALRCASANTNGQSLTRDGLSQSESSTLGIQHVLLVDDNPVNTIVAEAELRLLGLDVSTASSGQEALDWLTDHSTDLILMDCEMPGMDGVSATQAIRARERRLRSQPVPIVALTANGRDAYEQRCQPAGMDDYLAKPFDRADLRAVVLRLGALEGTVKAASAPA